MRSLKKSSIIFISVLLFCNFVLTSVLAETGADISKIIIKIDSDGLRAEIIATGKGAPPEGMEIGSPQARLSASSAATKDAYDNLIKVVKAIAPDYFPKERYLADDTFDGPAGPLSITLSKQSASKGDKAVKGARLVEVRYLGDGSAEADAALYIALNGPLANKFEKEMRLAGYRVVEYDRPGTEITEEMP